MGATRVTILYHSNYQKGLQKAAPGRWLDLSIRIDGNCSLSMPTLVLEKKVIGPGLNFFTFTSPSIVMHI